MTPGRGGGGGEGAIAASAATAAVKALLILNGLFIAIPGFYADEDLPKFVEPLQNVTIPVGREAVFSCSIENLQTYKIAWLRVDTQTILTIQSHVITKNHRMSVVHAEKRSWVLRIKDVKESDKGWYMCQINTDPMKNQVGYLDIVVPPDILDFSTSTDMVVQEGINVTLKCAARGSPPPIITWRREGNDLITLPNGDEVSHHNDSSLTIYRAKRTNMGAYLCIASNGIPPTVSKRIMLIVQFPPMISVQNQLVGASIGQAVTLDCHSEAYPKSINYWMFKNVIITKGGRYEPSIYESDYRVVMRLTIKSVEMQDFGSYRCVAKNSLGETDGLIKLYHIPQTTFVTTTLATTTAITRLPTRSTFFDGNALDDNPSNNNKLDSDSAVINMNKMAIRTTLDSLNSDGRERDNRYRVDNGLQGGGGSERNQHRYPTDGGLDENNNEGSYDASMSRASSTGGEWAEVAMTAAALVNVFRLLVGHALIIN